MTTWIVVADSSRGRIFENSRGRQINEILDLVNPAAREHARDIQSDANGRFQSKAGAALGARYPIGHDNPVEHEIELFAKRLSAYVDKARSEVRYDSLCIVAPPKFLGLLRGNLDKETQKLLKREIPKDLSKSDPATVLDYVKRLPD